MPLHIIACVKQVPDPEAPASALKVDEAAKKVVPAPGVASVISQFDALAVEAALRVKDVIADAKITVVSMGPAEARDVIKHSLAMGGDEGVLLTDNAFDNGDSYTTALVLSKAIQKAMTMAITTMTSTALRAHGTIARTRARARFTRNRPIATAVAFSYRRL